MDPTTLRMLSGAAAAAAPIVVITFTTDNYYPAWNATTTLSWNVTNSASQSIDQGIGNIAAAGSMGQQSNDVTRTYTLTAIGLDGITYNSSITIAFGAYPTCYWAQHGYPQFC